MRHIRAIKAFLFVVAIFIGFTTVAQYPSIHTARPRIYADADRLNWCTINHTVPGVFKDDYDDFIYRYENYWINDPELYLTGNDTTLWTWNWNSQWARQEAFFTVFIYKVNNAPVELKRCEFLARQVITAVNSADFSAMEYYAKETFLRQISECGGLILDWCYDDLPPSLRNELAQAMYAQSAEFMSAFILSSAGASYVSSHNTWNNILCNQNALALYHASGLSLQQQDTVGFWYQTVYNKHVNGFIPCWSYYRDDDGGWNWGAAYAMWSLVDQFQLFENMRIGTDTSFYNSLPWIQQSINQYVYFLQPDQKTIHLGDGVMKLGGADRTMYLTSNYYNDLRSKWLLQYWNLPENMSSTGHLFDKLLYNDYNAPLAIQPDLPLDWWTDKVGLSVSRSSWNEHATMITFFNSPSKRAAHEHRDNNSFTIFRNAPLLLDAGYYDSYASSHYLNYYQRTIAHNTICVYDSTESYANFGQLASNDGGQIESIPLQNYADIIDPSNRRGEWITYATGANYTYHIADAQLSYSPAKLDQFRRRLLYIKPGKVIVLDHIHLNNVATAQRDVQWVAHVANQPQISGSLVNTAVPGHIITYNGKDYTASNGNGNIAIRTVIPVNSQATLIGGEGYEYWINGTNYPPASQPDTSLYTPGSWRIEVRPDAIPTDGKVVYLHTIDIGDDAVPSLAGGVAMQSTVSVGADWANVLYFFSSDGAVGKDTHIFDNVAGGRTISVFAADLIPGTYDVKIDGAVAATQSTDTAGILQTNLLLSPGSHTLEITQNLLAISHTQTFPFAIYPNPAETELNIETTYYCVDFEVCIRDLKGQLLLKNQKQHKIDVSGLKQGIYIIEISVGNKAYFTKFVKS